VLLNEETQNNQILNYGNLEKVYYSKFSKIEYRKKLFLINKLLSRSRWPEIFALKTGETLKRR
jgi:hypothetical protein